MNILHEYRLWKWNRKQRQLKEDTERLVLSIPIFARQEEKRLERERIDKRNHKFGYRYFKTVSYTVDLDKLDAFLLDKKFK